MSSSFKRKLRILHVRDQAGVSGVLAKYQRLLGHEVLVVNPSGYDGLKQKAFYGIRILGKSHGFVKFGKLKKPLRYVEHLLNDFLFYLRVAWIARDFDIIHIHSQFSISFLIPGKPKIIEFHGDDIRRNPTLRKPIVCWLVRFYLWLMNGRRQFYVSTPDMLKDLPDAIWLPNPVDVDFFRAKNYHKPNLAVYFHNWYETGNHAKQFAKEHGWDLSIVERYKNCPIMYKDMVMYLNNFEWMIDRKNICSLSKTALEALACGVKVIDWQGNVHTVLPECHYPEVAAAKTIMLYENTLTQLGKAYMAHTQK